MDRQVFVAVMNEVNELLRDGRAAEALARLIAFDDGLDTAPDPQDYGWIVSYRFRAAFAAGDYEQALRVLQYGPARYPADIPVGMLATLYSMGVEAATKLGRADIAVGMADRCLELRRAHGSREEVLMAAKTAFVLLRGIERADLAARYAQILADEGETMDALRTSPDGTATAVTAAKQPPAEQCAQGEAADALLAAGRPAEAATAFRALLGTAFATGRPDPLIAAKSVLGLMMSLIFDNRLAEAHAIWIDEESHTRLGILALESGQVSTHDLIGYDLLQAYLYSLAATDRDQAAQAVDTLMARCVDYAFDRDRRLVPHMINNWRRHVRELHDDAPPPTALRGVAAAETHWGQQIPQGPLYWPRPYRWAVDWL
ncbi:hypothetical protein HLB23_05685 [Nocardia uniformis]|uniref:Uncharacterized protein n=1 Tax=Nocardia uniformis TaxID=53432 RepID=A0A849C0H1_9NOCA|nr:hypothetical protein [Nocardia uniformis]NNH69367.1 hypothetical protein [Nocardia uniformis]